MQLETRGEGYTLTAQGGPYLIVKEDDSYISDLVDYGQSFSFIVEILEGYQKGANFGINVNKNYLESQAGPEYTISNYH